MPLYLDPQSSVRVVVAGASLCVQADGAGERNVPLHRISRILAGHFAEFSTAALLACAERGITLQLLNAAGDVQARILGQPGERQELRQRLMDLRWRGDWQERYRDFVYGLELDVRAEARRKLGAPGHVGAGADLSVWLKKLAERYLDPRSAVASALWMRQFTDALMLAHVEAQGLGFVFKLSLDGFPDLVGDLARILRWRLEPLRIGWLRRRYHRAQRSNLALLPLTHPEMTRLFAKGSRRIAHCGNDITNRLRLWLVEMA